MTTTTHANITASIVEGVVDAISHLSGATVNRTEVLLNSTRKEFEGDITVVAFAFTKYIKKKPDEIAEAIGQYLLQHLEAVTSYNVIKGFLNLTISDGFWKNFVAQAASNPEFGKSQPSGNKVLVEFCSPNTNKPLHLGHIRNILLGWSISKILDAAGDEVVKIQIINDRGIAICKSMLAWQKFSKGATPETSNIKSDHFVGHYYVLFEKEFQAEYAAWKESDTAKNILAAKKKPDQPESDFFKDYKDQYFNQYSPLGLEAREMLRQWEAGDPSVMSLWKTMNQWVYDGFEKTYSKLGVTFDKLYYESQTYLLGKSFVQKGLDEGLFYRKEDGSVWVDLEDVKLDQKILLRSDGTSVYITQDLGTADQRYQDFEPNKMIYVVADEQNYHFKVLFEVLKKLGAPYAKGLYHLAYGMVELPSGKMKSREGTVVDADDLIEEVTQEAIASSKERGTLEDLQEKEQKDIIRKIGLAALKFFIVKVNPKKRMIFDPQESVDLQGQTGPYVQNAYVRIQSIFRKAGEIDFSLASGYQKLEPLEREIIVQLYEFPNVIQLAATEYDPSHVANYCYNLAKIFHRYYHDFPVLSAGDKATTAFRLQLSKTVGQVIRFGMDLLGIEMPEKM